MISDCPCQRRVMKVSIACENTCSKGAVHYPKSKFSVPKFRTLTDKKNSWATRGSANAYGGGIEPLLPSVKDLISIRIPRDKWKNIQQSTCALTFRIRYSKCIF